MLFRSTTSDERVYSFPTKDSKTGLPVYKYKPSTTYILAVGYPKGFYFNEWLKKVGNEAEAIKTLAGERGSKIHQGVEMLLMGEKVKHDEKLTNPTNGKLEEITAEEYFAIISFGRFWEKLKEKSVVRVLGVEFKIGRASCRERV